MSFSDDIKWSAPTHYIRGLQTVGPVTITGGWTAATLTTGDNSGTAGAGTTATSLVKPAASANWTADEMFAGAMFLRITSGGGAPAVRPITDNAAGTITVQSITGMDATSVFEISVVDPTYTFTDLTLSQNTPQIIIDACVIKKITSTFNTYVTIQNCQIDAPGALPAIVSLADKGVAVNECHITSGAMVLADDCYFFGAENCAINDGGIYVERTNDVQVGLYAEGCSNTALHLEGCLHSQVGIEAQGCTETPVHFESCNYVEPDGVGFIGTNAGAAYGILMEKSGYYDLTGGTLAGAADLRIEGTTVTWANLGVWKTVIRKGVNMMTTA